MSKSPDAFRTISEVADWLGIQAHVLRFWESKFTQVKPVKRAGGRRYYRPVDMLLLGGIKKLLHEDGLTIKGVQKILREQGVEYVSAGSRPLDSPARDDLGAPGALPKVVRIQSRGAPIPEHDSGPVGDADTVPDSPPESATPTPTTADAASDGNADTMPAPLSETAAGDGPDPDGVEAAGDTAPRSTPDRVDENTPAQPSLPSFLHRPAQPELFDAATPEPDPDSIGETTRDETEETPSEPDPDRPPQRVARQIEIADPPPEDEIAYRPGLLGQLVRVRSLSPNQAAEIAPVVADLRALFDRLSGHPPS